MKTVATNSPGVIRAFSSNQTPPASFNTLGFAKSRPAGAFRVSPGPVRTWQVSPYGEGTVGSTFGLRVVGLKPGLESGGLQQIPLFEGLCTLGAATGSQGTMVAAENRMVSGVTGVTVGVEGVQYTILTAGQSTTLSIDSQGCQEGYVEIGPGTADSANAILGSGPV